MGLHGHEIEIVAAALAILVASVAIAFVGYQHLSQTSASQKYLLMSAIVSFLGTILYNALRIHIVSYGSSDASFNLYRCYLYTESYKFYGLSKCFTLVFYCLRIYETFKDSPYPSNSKNIQRLITVIAVFYAICAVLFFVHTLLYLEYGNVRDDDVRNFRDCRLIEEENEDSFFLFNVVFLVLGEVMLCVVLLRNYISKLVLLVHARASVEKKIPPKLPHAPMFREAVMSNSTNRLPALNAQVESNTISEQPQKRMQFRIIDENSMELELPPLPAPGTIVSNTQTAPGSKTSAQQTPTADDVPSADSDSVVSEKMTEPPSPTTQTKNISRQTSFQNSVLEVTVSKDEGSQKPERSVTFGSNVQDTLRRELVELTVKSTNLVVIAVLSSFLAGFLGIAVGRFVISVDCLINTLCVLFTFKASTKAYRVLCWPTDKCWNLLYEKGLVSFQ